MKPVCCEFHRINWSYGALGVIVTPSYSCYVLKQDHESFLNSWGSDNILGLWVTTYCDPIFFINNLNKWGRVTVLLRLNYMHTGNHFFFWIPEVYWVKVIVVIALSFRINSYWLQLSMQVRFIFCNYRQTLSKWVEKFYIYIYILWIRKWIWQLKEKNYLRNDKLDLKLNIDNSYSFAFI